MDQRFSNRIHRSFAVSVLSEKHGQSYGIARNVSCGGILLEMQNSLPLGSSVYVKFMIPEAHSQIVMKGEVKHLYVFNVSSQKNEGSFVGMGIRFTEFEEQATRLTGETDPNISMYN